MWSQAATLLRGYLFAQWDALSRPGAPCEREKYALSPERNPHSNPCRTLASPYNTLSLGICFGPDKRSPERAPHLAPSVASGPRDSEGRGVGLLQEFRDSGLPVCWVQGLRGGVRYRRGMYIVVVMLWKQH